MRRLFAIALSAILLNGSPCAAQAPLAFKGSLTSLDLSPDGRTLVGIVKASVRGGDWGAKSSYIVWDVGCIFASIPGAQCAATGTLGSIKSTFAYWLPNKDSFVINSTNRVEISAEAPFEKTTTDSLRFAIRPKVVQDEVPDFPLLTNEQAVRSYTPYLSTDGQLVASTEDDVPDRFIVWRGAKETIPRLTYDMASGTPDRYEIFARGRSEDFYFWSSSLGARGLLLEYSPAARRGIPLPLGLRGSLQIVSPPSDQKPVAAFTADAIAPLATGSAPIEKVAAYVSEVRRAQPSLELKKVAVSDTLRVWALLFASADGAMVIDLVEPLTGNARGVTLAPRLWDGDQANRPPIRSYFVEIASKASTNPARLYAQESGSPPRKLVITFHGGPATNNISNDHEWTRYLASLGFDVLDVDYRGSTGYGRDHMLALKPPAARILAQDLESAVSWAKREGYREIGFLGTSAGGLAGVAELSASAQRLDFIILESPLIDWSPGDTVKDCLRVRGQTYERLFGFRENADGSCTPKSTGVMEQLRPNRTPVFILQGMTDPKTPLGLATAWIEKAKSRGACVDAFFSQRGGHTLVNWSRREQARLSLSQWIGSVENGIGCPVH